MRRRSVSYAVRRTWQTVALFDNGPGLLLGMASRRPELNYRTRTGLSITVPNTPGARFPIYEIHGDDIYRLGELLDRLPDDLVALDIGAHVGNFSLALAHRRPRATVYAFEPMPSTARYLQRNITDNGFSDRVVVEKLAVSGARGELVLIDNDRASAHNGLIAPSGSGPEVVVPCIGFKEALLRANGRADLVKLDAEGAEYDLILHSDPSDWDSVKAVVMEYHPVPGRAFDEIRAFLEAAGLHADLVRATPRGLGTAWFVRR